MFNYSSFNYKTLDRLDQYINNKSRRDQIFIRFFDNQIKSNQNICKLISELNQSLRVLFLVSFFFKSPDSFLVDTIHELENYSTLRINLFNSNE